MEDEAGVREVEIVDQVVNTYFIVFVNVFFKLIITIVLFKNFYTITYLQCYTVYCKSFPSLLLIFSFETKSVVKYNFRLNVY